MENIVPEIAFRVNTPRVAYQTLDGETVIIDFETGAYFSTDGIGAVIWEEVARNSTYGALVGLLCARYTGARAEIERAAARFLKELEDECLIVPCHSAADAAHQAACCDAPGPAASSVFRSPVLRKYTDMQALLLLDPIHEVDEQGWPIRKDPATE